MTNADKTASKLEMQGWEYDHRALVKAYKYAGTVDKMISKDGYDYCRVYTSECHMGKGGLTFQVSWVYRRER